MEKFEKNNQTIALSVLYAKKEKRYPALVPKHNCYREKQVNFNDSKWRRMTLSCSENLLLRRIHQGILYCLKCRHSFATEEKRKSHQKYVNKKIL